MFQDKPAWIEHQRRRFLRPDWQRYMRPDWKRWAPPEVRRWLEPDPAHDRGRREQKEPDGAWSEQDLAIARRNLAYARSELAAIKAELRFRQLLRKAGFNPDQPRVPAGDPDGGQWTSGEAAGGESNTVSDDGAVELAARRISPSIAAECELQYKLDIFQCRMVGLRACYAQAALRYANCLAGLPIPPLNY